MLVFKGMAMGAADIVPGVSGGTIAFITGIYQELIDTLSGVHPRLLVEWRNNGFLAFWQALNGNFLICLFSGILLSVFSLAKLISYLLVAHPQLVWSFFFGLIIASVWHVGRQVQRWSPMVIVTFLLGAAIAYMITTVTPGAVEPTTLNVFLAGMVAISAMILPGISGSFILLLLGLYQAILSAVKSLDFVTIGVFGAGCVCGLLAMSHLLSWAFRRFPELVLSLLCGFMVGALNKVWPWKHTVSFRTNSHGEQVPLEQINVMPEQYHVLTGMSPETGEAVMLAILAICLVLALEWLGKNMSKSVR
ncbi:membrane protein [Oleiphilus messinensis]|uniref:Membrane protein n=2 Tax=Oleiphilus messinensis TaxID=141451 RepID=A0A1Y0IDU6_9GAMM|nr:membrane protein [Oleiphilus messinensis]